MFPLLLLAALHAATPRPLPESRLADDDSTVAHVLRGTLDAWPADVDPTLIVRVLRMTCKATPRMLAALGRLLRRQADTKRTFQFDLRLLSPPAQLSILKGILAGRASPQAELPILDIHRLGPTLRPLAPALVRMLQSEDRAVRTQAAYALIAAGVPSLRGKADATLAELIESRDDNGMKPAPGIDDFGLPLMDVSLPRTAAALAAHLASPDTEVRSSAAKALGQLAFLGDVPIRALEKALEDDEADIPFHAAESLIRVGRSGKVVRFLLGRLPDEYRTRWAIHLLGKSGPAAREAVPHLARLLAAKRRPVHPGDAMALWRIARPTSDGLRTLDLRERALDTLGEFLKRDSTSDDALSCVAEIGPRAARLVPQVLYLLENADHLTGEALDALGRIGPAAHKAVPALRRMLRNPDSRCALAAAKALNQVSPGHREAVALALRLARDPLHKREALETLVQMRSREAVTLLLGELPNWDGDWAGALLWQLDPDAARKAGAW